MDQTERLFTELLSDHGLELSELQLEQFDAYYRELVDWNERMNLTGITEREQVYVKHFYDSLSLAFHVNMKEVHSIADIGSGAGFPSIPLKIAFPHLRVTIVDSLNKRILFLRHVVETLNLNQVLCVHGRAEEVARASDHRDRYDLVTARAVARLSILNEFCLPFAKTGGLFAAMKGSDPHEEVEDAAFSLSELNGNLIGISAFKLPVEEADRHIISIRKTASTPKKYPRKPGTPLKEPLTKR
ncbi:16S rRNA (guanine(527)-N(7))-methyltransferase RsmG [Gorillibacterium massiliense]|uniref:16S rRNA (guanine(527)-N(7))-methyltransferase RsmG n=1 Tax=Gorillibacterium massiliense TaxID=1280390 RepID=UPI0004AFEB51|nr:16S rRNA (guanine(527)-N(7))-methyltransferase RsmG [Gorillibacterium massiliense]